MEKSRQQAQTRVDALRAGSTGMGLHAADRAAAPELGPSLHREDYDEAPPAARTGPHEAPPRSPPDEARSQTLGRPPSGDRFGFVVAMGFLWNQLSGSMLADSHQSPPMAFNLSLCLIATEPAPFVISTESASGEIPQRASAPSWSRRQLDSRGLESHKSSEGQYALLSWQVLGGSAVFHILRNLGNVIASRRWGR